MFVRVLIELISYTYFNPNAKFDKWAAIEAVDFDLVADGMETIILPAGLYAVTQHKGPATFQYIFGKWLPIPGYKLDHRPHFEI